MQSQALILFLVFQICGDFFVGKTEDIVAMAI